MSTKWPCNPRIYEINTWVWLTTLSQKYERPITLFNVPDEVLDQLSNYQINAVWLMGVWFRGKSTRASALNYIHEYRSVLPDVTEKDIAGSAYAIAAYEVEEALGGRTGLAVFREQLAARGLKLILDYIPNHTGLDHRWLKEHPDYYIQADKKWMEKAKGEFFKISLEKDDALVIAHGRDPYFPGWIDTAQLNAYSEEYRKATVATLSTMATMADGVRCDMAMLMLNGVFKHTWGWLHPAMEAPAVEFWDDIIPLVKEKSPNFLFIAEAYWNLNHVLLRQGFDYTYDKTLYDRVLSRDVNGLRTHLSAEYSFLNRQVRFIENHDEKRASDTLGLESSRPAAVLITTLPGATLLHDGQFSGRKMKLPVHLSRQSYEREYPALKQFYKRLLDEVNDDMYRYGEWRMFDCYSACEGCRGENNLLTYGWRYDDEMRLIVLNLSGEWSQGAIDLGAWADRIRDHDWVLLDTLHRSYIDENGDSVAELGLYVDMEPHQAHIYHFEPLKIRKDRSRERTAIPL
jgi:hypothetical protein